MVQKDRERVVALMGYSGQRSVDPSHHPMRRGEDREEIRPRHFSFHPGTNRAWLLPQLPEEDWSIPKRGVTTYLESDEDVEHALFVCPKFQEKREKFRVLWEVPLTPEGIGSCLVSSERGWDAMIDLFFTFDQTSHFYLLLKKMI